MAYHVKEAEVVTAWIGEREDRLDTLKTGLIFAISMMGKLQTDIRFGVVESKPGGAVALREDVAGLNDLFARLDRI